MNSQGKRSLQSIHVKRKQEAFLGREKEEVLFQENLDLDEETRIFIFEISGQGGVGKTSLLRRFQLIAENSGALTVWNDEAQIDVLSVLAEIAKQLKKQGHELKSFDKKYQIYLQRRQELESDPNAPQGFVDFVGGLAKAGMRLAHHTPADVVLGFVDEDTVVKGVNNLTSSFIAHLKRKLSDEEARLVEKPVEELSSLLLKDLWEISAGERNLALFFDTYEYSSSYLEKWLLACLDGHNGEMPSNILLIIAGRDGLNKNRWEEYDEITTHISLEAFTKEEAIRYLRRKGIVDEQVVNVILQLSHCLPLLVAILAASRPNDPTQVGDPSGTALERFLKWVRNPKRRQVAINAAMPRFLNRDVVTVLEGGADSDELFNWLIEMPFMREHPNGGWVYHDVVRPQMIHHKYIESPTEWSELHLRLADYYQICKDNLGLDHMQSRHNSTWQAFSFEELYHRLCQAPHRYLSFALEGFLFRFHSERRFVRRWVETIQQVAEELQEDSVKKWGKLFDSIITAFDERRYQDVIDSLDGNIHNPEIDSKSNEGIVALRASMYGMTKQYQKAASDWSQLIELHPKQTGLLLFRMLDFIFAGEEDKAQADMRQIYEIDSKFLNNFIRALNKFSELSSEQEVLSISSDE